MEMPVSQSVSQSVSSLGLIADTVFLTFFSASSVPVGNPILVVTPPED